jgi:tetraprenyl-beta-curcumene synthase
MVLMSVLGRELSWIAPHVSKEIKGWRTLAEAIPDNRLRADALETLERERLNPEGAALFTALPRRRDLRLLRVLVAYQVALDFLDTISEQERADSLSYGLQLHRALVEALESPGDGISDYYAACPEQDDGGYLRALVEACRSGCAQLPGFLVVRRHATRAARELSVQVLNHQPEAQRTALLRSFARRELRGDGDTAWFERTAAASSTLGIYALLAMAVEPEVDGVEASAVDAAYHPWICLACTLLDCLVDQLDDERSGNHNYLTRYADPAKATDRIAEVVARSVCCSLKLHRGERHAVIVSAMVAMYLSKDVARRGTLKRSTRRIAASGGMLVRAQVPVLRVIRRAHGASSS